MSTGKWLAIQARFGKESLEQMLHMCADRSYKSVDFKEATKTFDYIGFHNSDCFILF